MSVQFVRRNARLILAPAVLALVTVVAAGTDYGTPQSGADGARTASVSLSGVMLRNYASVPELTAGAELIVVGRVSTTRSLTHGPLPFTLVGIEVEETLVDRSRSAGNFVNVLQTGGVMPPPKRQQPDYRPEIASFEGVPVPKIGERYVLFLRRYVGAVAPDAYIALGEFQGKLLVDDRNRISFPGDVRNLSDPKHAVQAGSLGRALAEVTREIRIHATN